MAELSPLASLDARPNNLPLQATRLLGREGDLQAVRGLVLRDDVRLVTLTGPGGSGKTRLGLQAATELLEQFEDGVFFVDLSPISDPGLVASTIARTFGLWEAAGRSFVDALIDFLHRRQLLLLLDNFEQILAAATTVADLLKSCPSLSVLVTSRAPLQIDGEHELPVPPLALPDLTRSMTPDHLSQFAAVALFVERGVAIRPDFVMTSANAPAVAEICARLDGLPLALELAAARIRLLSPEAILSRLGHGLGLLTGGRRDLPARQQTLRNTIAWSYDLLDPDEQRLFRRLSVFVAGFTLDAAETVCKVKGDLGIDVLDGLESLASKSLVKQQAGAAGDARFTMLETIREYALERLEESGEAESTRSRHLRWCLEFAEHARELLVTVDGVIWLDRLSAEHDNFRAALSWSLNNRSRPSSAHYGFWLATVLHLFWFRHDHLSEGRRWYERALAREKQLPRAGHHRDGPGDQAHTTGPASRDGRGDEQPSRQAETAWGSSPRTAMLNAIAMLMWHQQDLRQGDAYAQEALNLARAGEDSNGCAHALVTLGNNARARGENEQALVLHEEALTLFRADGDVHVEFRGIGDLAATVDALGDRERALSLFEESLATARGRGDPWRIAMALNHLGWVALRNGDLDRATEMLEESLMWWRRAGATRGPHWSLASLGRVALARDDLPRAAAYFRESMALCLEARDRQGVASSLIGLASIPALHARDASPLDAARATCLLGAVEALCTAGGFAPGRAAQYDRDRAVAATRTQLGETAFAAAWEEGQAMSFEEAVEHALAIAAPNHAEPPASAAGRTAGAGARQATDPELAGLTPRERDVALLVTRGSTNRQIAADLVLSERTVDSHIRNIMSKLEINSRAQIAAWAVQHGLVAVDS